MSDQTNDSTVHTGPYIKELIRKQQELQDTINKVMLPLCEKLATVSEHLTRLSEKNQTKSNPAAEDPHRDLQRAMIDCLLLDREKGEFEGDKVEYGSFKLPDGKFVLIMARTSLSASFIFRESGNIAGWQDVVRHGTDKVMLSQAFSTLYSGHPTDVSQAKQEVQTLYKNYWSKVRWDQKLRNKEQEENQKRKEYQEILQLLEASREFSFFPKVKRVKETVEKVDLSQPTKAVMPFAIKGSIGYDIFGKKFISDGISWIPVDNQTFQQDSGDSGLLSDKRTPTQVMEQRRNGGCCDRFADRMCCDCLSSAYVRSGYNPDGSIPSKPRTESGW